MALSSLTGITNAQLWELARKASPTFKSHTAKATADTFTEKGFEALTRSNINVINEFFELSLRVGFQMLNVSKARNPLAATGLVQTYDTPNGGFVQRIAVNSIKPVSPRFKGLEDGQSVDPYTVRKPESSERFFPMNFDYQSFITIQDYQVRTIFISEYGMGAYVAGIMEGLRNGYTIQEFENTLECLNVALNSTTYPLKDTQIVDLDTWGSGTGGVVSGEDLIGLIKNIKDITTAMETTPQSGAFNAAGFETVVDPSDLVLLMRAGLKTEIDLKLEVGAFNPDRLSLPYEIKELQDFGGLKPYVTIETVKTYVTECYDSNGTEVGYVVGTPDGAAYKKANGKWYVKISTVETECYMDKDVSWEDPNEDILAILIQKGAIFENAQNPYVVRPAVNPAGLYTNYWASRPNNGINFDYFYTMVVFRKPQGD